MWIIFPIVRPRMHPNLHCCNNGLQNLKLCVLTTGLGFQSLKQPYWYSHRMCLNTCKRYEDVLEASMKRDLSELSKSLKSLNCPKLYFFSMRQPQLYWDHIKNAWGVSLAHLFNFLTISLEDCLVWCPNATKLSSKWERSTLSFPPPPSSLLIEESAPIRSSSGGLFEDRLVGQELMIILALTFWPVN